MAWDKKAKEFSVEIVTGHIQSGSANILKKNRSLNTTLGDKDKKEQADGDDDDKTNTNDIQCCSRFE